MFGYEGTQLIRIATLVVAIVVIYRFFSWRDKKNRPQYETVHVATADESQELCSAGLAVDGRVVDIQAPDSTGSPKRSLMPPIVPDLVPLLIGAIVYFLYQVVSDLRKLMRQDEETQASPAPIQLSRSPGSGEIPLLYEFDVEQDGEPRTVRGAHFFEGEPYHAVEMVGKEVTVRYLPQDPSVSMLEASVFDAYS